MKTALVLTGGGSKGAIEVGVLKVLVERKIIPDVVIGTSVGAINGAIFLDGKNHQEALARLEDAWQHATRKMFFPFNPAVLLQWHHAASIFHSRGLQQMLAKYLKSQSFKELSKPLHVNCTRLSDGKSVFFNQGNLHETILASSALTPFYPPVRLGDELYTDGSFTNYLGLQKAEELKCERIILVNLGYHQPPKQKEGLINMTLYMNELMKHQLIMNAIALHKRKNFIEIAPKIASEIHLTDFSHTKELIREGVIAARRTL